MIIVMELSALNIEPSFLIGRYGLGMSVYKVDGMALLCCAQSPFQMCPELGKGCSGLTCLQSSRQSYEQMPSKTIHVFSGKYKNIFQKNSFSF